MFSLPSETYDLLGDSPQPLTATPSTPRLRIRLGQWESDNRGAVGAMLLMCEDRVGDPDLKLTHEFLSLVLGVRRSGVTDALRLLEGKHLIRSTRGICTVIDRQGLIELLGGIYGVPEAEYDRLIGSEAMTSFEFQQANR
ncbi:helix-turn-helix domain-containing protein [Pararhizobium sp. BT-229]|uniref:helix-turn-helix domain-containing protein n=1 Tax=Pararhizobium sp. BT-229 TaxID=2986923 RepID=UPI0035580A3B